MINLQPPYLPLPPSWFPGHMRKFLELLPALLTRTDVVVELRDARLPFTSINSQLEGALRKWRAERGRRLRLTSTFLPRPCEHLIVFSKRDLVPEWGIEPFQRAMTNKFPEQTTFFATWQRQRDIQHLSDMLVNVAKQYPHSPELNVLVVGMPNVGKSTLLNSLRNIGIKGPTPKALQTSAQPGLTQALSTRLKLSVDPPIYAFDSPGVMLPFLGSGKAGAERGVKLALIAGIKEGLYDVQALAEYLLYRLNVLNPIAPAYMELLPDDWSPTTNIEEFLEGVAYRMGMMTKGGEPDLARSAVYVVRWWRDHGARRTAAASLRAHDATYPDSIIQGWGFDLQWHVTRDELKAQDRVSLIQSKMEECVDEHRKSMQQEEEEGVNTSATQKRKATVAEQKMRRQQRNFRRRKH
ncbi:P-loop containing nucleoside triphosphate hydrolase protein [Fistulina hepatica ATCC 64428]|uniref:p-loop containing nucleoside triphosphate hydrolase protein n=1 Tax=Fistulina hepatica ATCC 64428 TaxID=1128425 RepID=A0A0D7A8R2_9AGAR|nr:P-loop containing nucleoside triphosphate hydrolase protein [Fistulina hepatica ATCC 64428]